MNDPLLLGFVVAAVVVTVAILRLGSRDHDARLARVEAKLDALMKHQGVQFDPFADVPAPVIDALRQGRKIEAIKAYRVATGAGLKDAKDVVEELQRRAAVRA
jgi:ribosomal protein L7/L12